MKSVVIIAALVIASASLSKTEAMPTWFLKAFTELGLNQKYSVVNQAKPTFLEADFNGDGKNDIAAQVIDKKTKKKGILIINAGQLNSQIFGAGVKIKGEDFDNVNWVDGWRINKDKVIYETIFKPDGDIVGSRKIRIKFPSVSVYAVEDGSEIAGILIYWSGTNYISIHQGE